MRARGRHLVLALALVAAAGGGKATPPPAPSARPAALAPAPAPALALAPVDELPTIPASPQPAPADLLATASIGDPIAVVTALVAYADAVQPGIGAMVTPASLIQMATAQGLDLAGVDLTRPAQAFLLDPGAHPDPVVVVVAVADERALRAQVDALGQRW